MKIRIVDWMAPQRQPIPDAVQVEDGIWEVNINSLDALISLAGMYDLMIVTYKNNTILYVDQPGKRFRMR